MHSTATLIVCLLVSLLAYNVSGDGAQSVLPIGKPPPIPHTALRRIETASYHLSWMNDNAYHELGELPPAEKSEFNIHWPREYTRLSIVPGNRGEDS